MDENLRVRDVGEFGLIDLLLDALPVEARESAQLSIGIGDDAAVWAPDPGSQIVLTTDSLVDGVHFRRDWTDWESLGHKILAVNISDLAAMGAKPALALVTLCLDGEELVPDLLALYRGMGSLARRFGVAVAGGDIVRSPLGLTFHVSAVGEARGGKVLTRSGANVGDLIGVSGGLGASAAGLRLLGLSGDDPRRMAATAELLIASHLRPEPRVALGQMLLEHGATAAMDLSDGLLGDLPKILVASEVSAKLDARRVPAPAAVRALFPDRWLEMTLRGGEDYELLFTVPPERWEAVVLAAADIGSPVTAIGEITAAAAGGTTIQAIDLDGEMKTIVPGAFDHFDSGG